MGGLDQAFFDELRKDFVLEAEEYLQTIVSGLIELEKKPAAGEKLVEGVFRAAHSLKGAAHAVQMPRVAELCQGMESVFSGLKKGTLQLVSEDFDVLQRSADVLSRMIANPEADEGQAGALLQSMERMAARKKLPPVPGMTETVGVPEAVSVPVAPEPVLPLASVVPEPLPAPVEAPKAPVEPPKAAASDMIRIGAARLDALLLQSEELVAVKLALAQRRIELREILDSLALWKTEEEKASLRRGASAENDAGAKTSRESLERNRQRLLEMEESLRALENRLAADQRTAGTLVDNLLEGTKSVLMLPMHTLLQSFPKLVRDLARELGKGAELTIRGDDIELDKRILEGMKDPLIHLVRNAVDHGIEKPEARRARGKPPAGALSISVSRIEGSRVEIVLSDDGEGIDAGKLRTTAVKEGVLSYDEARALDDAAALKLIFRSGLSTSPIITSLSGRGLGMAIVQEGAERLGGSVELQSEPGRGTTFRISLPLTLASFRGVLVREWERFFVVPTANVGRVARIHREHIRKVENRESVTLGGAPVALVRLGGVLALPAPRRDPEEKLTVVLLHAGDAPVAFAVDEILNEQEVLLKPLGRQLRRVRHMAGATVLGSGAVVPVLDAADLIRSVTSGAASSALSATSVGGEAPKRRPSVLIAEDSITSRTLLKNILTAAGYDVQAEVDGVDALNALAGKTFDVLVSDVEMPRMNGFELTTHVRAEPRFAELPVVLVTSLESREDRERGVEAGANAYIVKSSFDQSNLLDVLRRLL